VKQNSVKNVEKNYKIKTEGLNNKNISLGFLFFYSMI